MEAENEAGTITARLKNRVKASMPGSLIEIRDMDNGGLRDGSPLSQSKSLNFNLKKMKVYYRVFNKEMYHIIYTYWPSLGTVESGQQVNSFCSTVCTRC